MTGVAEVVRGAAADIDAGRPFLLLCDFDGTLSPTVDRPEWARLPPRARSALGRLAAQTGCHVGIVSGRSLADLAGVVGMPCRYLAGSGGLELRCEGRRLVPPGWREAVVFMATVLDDVRRLMTGVDGVWVEPKDCAITIHHREAAAQAVRAVRDIVGGIARRYDGRCRVIEGALGVELMAFPRRDKSSAVRFFRRQAGGERVRICYCGNDGNDAPAMAFVNGCGGWSIGVGAAAPREARWILPDPAALSEFLVTLADAVDRRPPYQ